MKFFRRSLKISFKLWLAMILLILIVLGTLGATLSILFSDFYVQEKLNAMQSDSADIATELAKTETLQQRIDMLEGMRIASGTQVLILDSKGSPVISIGSLTAEGRTGMGWRSPMQGSMGRPYMGLPKVLQIMEYLTEENINRVLQGEDISVKATSGSDQETLLIAAVSIPSSLKGVVIMGSSPAPVQDSINTFRRLIVYASLLAIIVATIIARLLSRQVTKPLALMNSAASRMAQGDFQPIIDVKSEDELGELAKAFNSMSTSLHEHMEWLDQEKNLLTGIIESISDGVIMVNSEGYVMYANESAQTLWLDHGKVFENRKNKIITFLQDLVIKKETSAILTLESQIIQVVLAPMGKSEQVNGYVAIIRDVTASLRAEKSRREFLASITHELRTPLHLVQGYLEAIQDEVIPDKERPAYIQIALEEAKRLARLVQSLQEIDSLEHGLKINKKLINISDFMKDLRERFKGKARSLGINLSISEEEGSFKADYDRLLQVFINLMDNAMRHTPANKSVSLQVDQFPDHLKFTLADEGEGIPEEAQPHIFDKFYRVDKSRSRRAGGMGLGLAIVKQIVEAHEGTINVVSKKREGTKFIITLPK